MKGDEQSNAIRQEQEIQALKAIYDEDFVETPRKKAWKVCTQQQSGFPEIHIYVATGSRCTEWILVAPKPSCTTPVVKVQFSFERHVSVFLWSKYRHHLFFSLPKIYPSRALPTIKLVQPIIGLKPQQISSAERMILQEARSLKGEEMLFQVCSSMCLRASRSIHSSANSS